MCLHTWVDVHTNASPALLVSKGGADQDGSLETATFKDG